MITPPPKPEMTVAEIMRALRILLMLFLIGLQEVTSREHVRELEVSEKVPKGTLVGFIGDGGPPYLIVTVPGSGVDTDLSIEESTGEIRTKVPLDRETRASYSLVAIPQNGENRDVRVTVRVLDENDNAPTFPSPVMHIEFPENTPRDVKRTLHPARDLDLGIYNTQRYNIVSGNVNNAFRLSSHRERDGVLYLDLQINGFLDRETTAAYSLVIEALDGGTPPLKGSMTVNITIQDVNDNQPIFNQSRYFATVPENATVGTSVLQVFATDSDAGENGLVRYSINRRQSDREGMFRVDANTGLIVVNRPLDFETKEVHELAVVARDSGVQPLETTAFISIRVTDVNDNQPTINVIFLSDDATPKISESAQPGEFVARISVNDPDSKTEYSNVSVTLEGGEGHFGLATRDNIIYLVIVALPIDRESKPNYTLSVIATDTGSPPLHASRTFHLRVTDVNDNAPEFEKPEYEADVLEVAEPGTSVFQVAAKDRDEGDNSVLSYSIVNAPSTYANWFQIDSKTGLITTRSHVDCETASEPLLTIRAVDSGSPPLSSETTLRITIHDVNDNEPVFLQTFYNTTVPENADKGTCFLKVTANDSDCGVNAKVNYTLGEESTGRLREFQIKSDTGEICIVANLDYEKTKSYEFPVVASDRGGLSTTAIVKVLVTDVNDNHPVFYPREYNVSLSENKSSQSSGSSSSPVVAVVATDEDSGNFGTVSYRIVSGNEGNVFRIDRTTGEIFVAQPKALSAKTRYKLNVSAVDGGGLRSAADAEVYVAITDSTRSPLVFERPKYRFGIREDARKNSVVGSVKASQQSGSSSGVQYFISSGDPDGNFSIDSDTGVIRTATPLDHETHPFVLLNVQAVSADPPIYGHTQVNIVIEDVNDNAPEFGSDLVRISVPEDLEPGTPLYQAHARDRDSGRNSQVRYHLAAEPGPGDKSSGPSTRDLFAIDPLLGHLTLTRHLDYEMGQRHSLVVVATDSGVPSLSSNMSLVVEVQDVNDNPPVFERSEYSISVLESLPVNSQILQVTAVDQDTGNNARLTYRIKNTNGSNGSEVFGIFPNSGLIYLKEKLDRETKGQYEITVGVTDNGTPADTATTKVTVTVLDVNDNDPRFNMDGYEFHLQENSPVGTFVGKITAVDADFGPNALLKFSFIPGSTTFRMNPTTGDIYAKKPLDREVKSSYELVAEARDQGVPPRSVRVPIRIHVTDVNDNSPELVDPREDVVSVREEQPPGTEVTRIKAIDRDEGNNASITYSILKGRDSDGYGVFTVDPVSGSVRTRIVLDHEERSIYRLAVAATDGGNPPRQTVRILRVEVLDLSDHRPTFTSSSLHFKVKENVKVGYVVGSVAATDSYNTMTGQQNNNLIRYTLTGGSTRALYDGGNHLEDADGALTAFEIDKKVGNLVVCRDLDRERQSEYLLEVRALDTTATNNPQSSAVSIRIEVVDVNDNAPTWPSNLIRLTLPEDTPVSTVISNYSASDADASFNADLRYSLVRSYPKVGAKVFAVDALTGIITLNSPLDYEDLREYTIVVSATDQAVNVTERRSTSVTFVVKVTDANDNDPEFISPKSKVVSFNDVIEPGTVVAKVIAVDRDSGENGRVSYTITGGNDDGRFSLERDTGYLTLSKSFTDNNTLKKNSYLINVTAKDHGTPPRHSLFPLRILIRGSTDSPPKFLNSTYVVAVPEDIPPGSLVIALEARSTKFENGVNRNLTYHIPRGLADDKFAVDPHDGVVTTRSPLDRESKARYLLPVYVTDQTGKRQFDVTLLTVNVLDVNDHAPEFKRGSCYPIHVPENSNFSVIHKVTATDLDEGVNGEITYSITSGNVGNKFNIDMHTGLLSARPLDRETHAKYVLLITAQDRSSSRPMQGSCNVTIIVDDENDNDPRFSQQKYTASIPEDTAVDSQVLTVQATDADVGVNSRIVYSLANESHWLFKIDNKTGVISTSGLFDREKRSIYEFQVVATDGGRYDARSKKVPVQVTITDVNDNKPVFSSYPFAIQVPVYTQAGAGLIKITATDADEGTNSEIVYSFMNETGNSKFKINPNTGLVMASSSLSGDAGRLFHLEILARDRGNPPQSGRGLLEIRVGGGVENSALRFQNSSYEVTIAENLPNGKEVLQVSAVRTDGRRQKIRYSLLTGKHENVFSIDSKTGWIRVENQGKLDYESYKEMKFSVMAEADGPLYGYCEVKIKLEDENDNAPRFTQEHYTASVWEGNNKGTFVMQVSATDQDESSNAHVHYHIVDGNHDNAFVIEPAFSGLVKTNIVLDREIRDTYKLTIIATDEGSPQLTGTTTIRINIVDVNDNQPTFPPHSAISVSEGTEVGTVLTGVTANDVDTNPALTYFFTEETDEFSIDRFSGKIVLGKKLDFESKKEYKLAIAASDTAHTARTSLIIRVTDVNDNPPAFWQPAYQVALPDGPDVITPLLTVNASDSDSGNNAKVRFSLLENVEGFTIDNSKGALYSNKSALSPSLVTDGIKDVDLVVVATDLGKPALSSMTSVRVRVNNDRDFVPYFTQEEYQIRIREDSRPGTSILRVSSTDNGKNSADFTIFSGNDDGIFQILSPSGDLILLKEPDRERKNSYSLQVSAGNLMYRSNNATIYVTIDDANDNAPAFQGVDQNGSYQVYLSESAPVGTVVVTLFANDTDLPGGSNTELYYEIISGNDEDLFSIDAKDGTIRVQNSLDYDKGDTNYELLVRVSDQAKLPDRSLSNLATVHIRLKDENDNAPKFPVLEYLEFVAENEPVGTSVFIGRALDDDKGPYGKLNYSILSGTASGMPDVEGGWKLFRVDPVTGVVSTNAVFDYENKNCYAFMLQAMDIGGKATKVRVHIEIESKDEYHPQFTDRTYRFVVPPAGRERLLPVGSIVGSVEATDRDKGPDGMVVYQLTTQQTYFKINRTTGAIIIKKKLDDNVKVSGRDISFIVTASSGKQGSLTNTTVVEIVIDPLSEHGINLASAVDGDGATLAGGGGLADWALGLLIALILILLIFGAVFLFLHVKNRRHKKVNKPVLTSGVVNPADGFVDPSAFDTVPIRGTNGIQATGPFAPPKYDEIPPYGNAHRTTSSSGNATTSELSGSEQSGSSGRGSAEEGEDVEDEEIRMINEGPLQRDGGLHRQTLEEDNVSDLSVHNTQEYLARLGIVDNSGIGAVGVGSTGSRRSSDALSGGNKDILQQGVAIDSLHMFDEEGTAETDISNLIYAKLALNDVSERGSAEDSSAVDHVILSGFDVPGVNGVGTQQPSMTGSLSSIVHSEEELTGSYNWDYLLDWGPQYQPLAHVFSEIARLKDDTASVQSTNSGSASSKGGKGGLPTTKTLPPPLLTSVAPRSIAPAPVIAPRGPGHTSHHSSGTHLPSVGQQQHQQQNHQLLLLPRSPISHDATGASFSTSAAMSPSFSPSLSPLATRSPSISPLFTPGMAAPHHAVPIPRQTQRTAVNETELRI